ncbi:DUF805 domain-containing protein [Paracoccus aurantiacus]|nr:DUF805 domain-containing protein [Paracoccus aurantiacus]
MTFASAIRRGITGSLDWKGRSSRAEYLPFICAAALLLAAIVAVLWQARDTVPFGWAVLLVLALFYLPVTAAGARRLNDVGERPGLMLVPLMPVAGLGIVLLVLCLLKTPATVMAMLLTLWFMPGLSVTVALLVLGTALIATLIAFSHVTGLLLLPSQPPLDNQKGLA